jgi:hypothetical protein
VRRTDDSVAAPAAAMQRAPRDIPARHPVEIWFQDKMRVGQKNKLTYPLGPDQPDRRIFSERRRDEFGLTKVR